jgi:hypothetical protein
MNLSKDGFRPNHSAFFLRAALAPSLPNAVLTFLGKCATVRFRLAAVAARLTFFFAASFCFLVVMAEGFS